MPMASSKGRTLTSNPAKPDRHRVDLSTSDLARRWCKHFGKIERKHRSGSRQSWRQCRHSDERARGQKGPSRNGIAAATGARRARRGRRVASSTPLHTETLPTAA